MVIAPKKIIRKRLRWMISLLIHWFLFF